MTSEQSDVSVAKVFEIAWPLAMRAVMLHGIVVIDGYLVASLGEEALAAMGLASALSGLLLGVLGAFAMATQIRLAQAFGSGRDDAMRVGFASGLTINLAIAAIGIVILLALGGWLLASLAHSPEISAAASEYLQIILIVVAAEAAALHLSSHFNACGDTKLPFYSYVITVPVNVALSIILIHGLMGAPEMGVAGAAAGSAISSVLRLAFLAAELCRQYPEFARNLFPKNTTLTSAVWRHLKFALPIAATFTSGALANSVCMLIYARLDVNEFAAMTLIMPWVILAGTLGMSWAQATGIVIAQLLGRGILGDQLDHFLSKAWRNSFLVAALVAIVYLCVCLGFGVLYPDLSTETRTALFSFLPILLLLPFPKESNAICGNTLRAGGETVYVMHIFLWSQWLFRVPVTAVMVFYLDLSVFWIFSLLLFEEVIKFPAFHNRLFRGKWKQTQIPT